VVRRLKSTPSSSLIESSKPRAKRPTPAARDPSSNDPSASVETLPGVGPALAEILRRVGLNTLQDLWFHLPLRYEDRTHITPIRDLRNGEAAQVQGRIEAIEKSFRYRPQLRIAIGDDSRQTLTLRFFHFNNAQVNQLAIGGSLRCFGEPRFSKNGFEMVHPQYRRIADGMEMAVDERLTPVYPTTEGLGQPRLVRLIEHALKRLPTDDALEFISPQLRKMYKLSSLRDALLYVHQPPPDADLAALAAGIHPAQQRLAFEELLAQHLSLKRLRARARSHAAPKLDGGGHLRKKFVDQLAFALTKAQKRVATEIVNDLATTQPMLRLVQGDVGSGKTVVAALAALTAIEAGYQVALMAPTELLAEQHFRNFQHWMQPLDVDVVWLAGKLKGKARASAMAALASSANIAIGTHALMQEGVQFAKLGLVIIDEQHRFGVHQRLMLRDKGRSGDIVPHQLVLTATPIPRTLAMTAYADLDVSAIDELPPGRTPVATVAIANSRRDEVVERIRAACADGRQAYWVCTIIEESEQLQAQAAEAIHLELSNALPEHRVDLVHGRLKPVEKQAAMDNFSTGKTALLVATTVIEVGVDVPNASLMIVENAERLGLAQLHQLRGRVGRGRAASSCVLLYQAPLSPMARQRLDVLRETGDGFRIAEKDLELRGPGEVLGTRQTGQLALRIADISRDAHLLPSVQRAGEVMLREHPELVERLVDRWIGSGARYAGA
jgi:ATP-dependent DNA helicase RecG